MIENKGREPRQYTYGIHELSGDSCGKTLCPKQISNLPTAKASESECHIRNG